MKRIIIALCTCLLLIAAGCRSHKEAVETAPRGGEWTTLEIPIRVQLTAPARIAASGKATMVRGQSVAISLRLLGFEVASAYVDADTVVLIDKFNGRYFATSYQPMAQRYGIDIAALQDIMLGSNGRPVYQFSKAKGVKLTAAYSDPAETPYGIVAQTVDLQGATDKLKAQATVTWQPAKALWNSPVNISQPNTRNYTPIDISSLLRNISPL